MTKNYKIPEFREDLKSLYDMAGVDGKATNFLFNDTQVTDEGFLEIINNMLSTGEVASLYKPDEFEDVSIKRKFLRLLIISYYYFRLKTVYRMLQQKQEFFQLTKACTIF